MDEHYSDNMRGAHRPKVSIPDRNAMSWSKGRTYLSVAILGPRGYLGVYALLPPSLSLSTYPLYEYAAFDCYPVRTARQRRIVSAHDRSTVRLYNWQEPTPVLPAHGGGIILLNWEKQTPRREREGCEFSANGPRGSHERLILQFSHA